MRNDPPGSSGSKGPKTEGDKAGHIYARIKGVLLWHRLPPSTFLNIRTLSQSLKVSPTPVREALIRLANEDIVVQAPAGRGFFTRAPQLDALSAEYEAAIVVGTYALDLGERSGFRLPNPPLGRKATVPAPAEKWLAFLEAMHLGLARSTRNGVLLRVAEKFVETTRFLRAFDLESAERIEQVAVEMQEFDRLISDGDMSQAILNFKLQGARRIEMLPGLLQGVLRNAAAERRSIEAMLH